MREIKKQWGFLCAVVFCAAGFLAGEPCLGGPTPEYEFVDLGVITITGGGARDINQLGQVTLNLSGTGYIWDNGVLSPPEGLPNNNTPFALNDLGHATWVSSAVAQFYDGNTTIALPTLEPGGRMSGQDLNNSDVVVGYGRRDGAYRGFVWDGTMRELESFTPDDGCRARAINDADVIVGEAYTNNTPVQWINETIEALPMPSGTNRGSANDVNALGQSVGYTWDSGTPSADYYATLWSGGTATTLGQLGSLRRANALGINDVGQVVGYAWSPHVAGTERAFLYSDGQMYSVTDIISEPGWEFRYAHAINNAGQIVGTAYSGGDAHAVLLNPVPEPSTWLLCAVGALGLLAWRRLRKRR